MEEALLLGTHLVAPRGQWERLHTAQSSAASGRQVTEGLSGDTELRVSSWVTQSACGITAPVSSLLLGHTAAAQS